MVYLVLDCVGTECSSLIEGTTTESTGSTSVSQCICKTNFFANETNSTFRCEACTSTHSIAALRMTNCSINGATLDKLPIMPGYWRQGPESRRVRSCSHSGGCLGGVDTSRQCALGHNGPLCDLCSDGYHGGKGAKCELCTGSSAVSIILPIIGTLAVIVLFLFLRIRFGTRYTIGKLRDIVDTAGGQTIEVNTGGGQSIDVASALMMGTKEEAGLDAFDDTFSLAKAAEKKATALKRDGGYHQQRLAWLSNHSSRMAVKVRILISFMQVLTQLGLTFSIPYPSVYADMLSFLSTINFSVGLLPFACVMPFASTYYFELLTKTLLPLVLILGCWLAAKQLRKRYDSSENDSEEAESADKKPIGLFMAELCGDLWFYIIFLTYPSSCAAIFKFFLVEKFDGDGEDGMNLLRVDRSINTASPTYALFFLYALLMVIVFPIGVPALYAGILFRSRDQLRALRHMEMSMETEFKAALLRADGEDSEEQKEAVLKGAEAFYVEASAALRKARDELPSRCSRSSPLGMR